MGGGVRCLNNVFVEQHWRTVRPVYLRLTTSWNGKEMRIELSAWGSGYNRQRPRSNLGAKTPDEVYHTQKNGYLWRQRPGFPWAVFQVSGLSHGMEPLHP